MVVMRLLRSLDASSTVDPPVARFVADREGGSETLVKLRSRNAA